MADLSCALKALQRLKKVRVLNHVTLPCISGRDASSQAPLRAVACQGRREQVT
jgi:hypothetical protein